MPRIVFEGLYHRTCKKRAMKETTPMTANSSEKRFALSFLMFSSVSANTWWNKEREDWEFVRFFKFSINNWLCVFVCVSYSNDLGEDNSKSRLQASIDDCTEDAHHHVGPFCFIQTQYFKEWYFWDFFLLHRERQKMVKYFVIFK